MISKEIEVYQVIGDLDEECRSHKVEMRHYKPTDSNLRLCKNPSIDAHSTSSIINGCGAKFDKAALG